MTIEEFLAQGVDDLRLGLQNIFEDPAGEFVEMRKPALLDFARTNRDAIEEYLSATEPSDEPEEEMGETPLGQEPEPAEEESAATPGWEGNPKTNLHTGAPGNLKQREGTKDLA